MSGLHASRRGAVTPWLIGLGVVAALACFVFAGWFVFLRDSWEADNGFRVRQISTDVIASAEKGDEQCAVDHLAELRLMVGARLLKDDAVRTAFDSALAVGAPLEKKLADARAAAENKQKESETLAKLSGPEKLADDEFARGRLEPALAACTEALKTLSESTANSAALTAANQRLLALQSQLKFSISEEERIAALRCKVQGGAWLGRKAGTSESLRGLDLYVLPHSLSALDTAAFLEAVVEGERGRVERAKKDLLAAQERLAQSQKTLDKLEADREKFLDVYLRFINEAVDGVNSAKARVTALQASISVHEESVRRTEAALNMATAASAADLVEFQSLFDSMPLEPTDSELHEWALLIARNKLAGAHTDVDGKYEIEVRGGRHFLFAQFETERSKVRWFLPLAILDDKDQKVDLRNENAAFIWNKQD